MDEEIAIINKRQKIQFGDENPQNTVGDSLCSELVHGVSMTNNMRKLCCTPKLSDVTLVVANERIRAHRAVLYAASPVFSDMFQGKAEVATDRTELVIKNVEPEVLRQLLEFIYGGSVEPTRLALWPAKLWLAAVQFEIPLLKMVAHRQMIVRNMTNNDCLVLLSSFADAGRLTDKKDAELLKFAIIHYITNYGMT
jgi:hypothetical protein